MVACAGRQRVPDSADTSPEECRPGGEDGAGHRPSSDPEGASRPAGWGRAQSAGTL